MMTGLYSNATEPASWRAPRETGVAHRFGSGRIAYVKGLEVDFFVKTGKVPDFLTPFMVDLVDKGSGDVPKIQSLEEVKSFIELLDLIVLYSFIYPKVVRGTTMPDGSPLPDDTISLDDVSYMEKLEALRFLGKPTQQLQNFHALS